MSTRLRRLRPLGPAAARAGVPGRAGVPARAGEPGWAGEPGRAGPAGDGGAAGALEIDRCGAKAARLSAALRAGFPVLPGWVVPSAESRPAVRAAAAVLRGGQPAAGRRAVLSHLPDPALAAEFREAAARLGGRVIVRSSSRLEADPRWSGAFSTVADVTPDEVMTAVRSCWASAFAVDPLARLGSCGLPLESLELAVLIQPEIGPDAGGVARVAPTTGDGVAGLEPLAPGGAAMATERPAPAGRGYVEVVVEGIEGHPGALLAGWADGASARVRLPVPAGAAPLSDGPGGTDRRGRSGHLGRPAADGSLLDLLGSDLVISVARLAAGVYRCLGDETIEWAVRDGQVWLFQSRPAQPAPVGSDPGPGPSRGPGLGRGPGLSPGSDPGSGPSCGPGLGPGSNPGSGPSRGPGLSPGPHPGCGPASAGAPYRTGALCGVDAPGLHLATREWMPLLTAAVQQHGRHLRGRPAVAGQAAGRLVTCRPHERPPAASRDAILLIDRPLPALAPLLFGARGVLARSGAAGSHLAEVARSLSVPMVTGCPPETVTSAGPPGASWLAAIDGTTGDVALYPG